MAARLVERSDRVAVVLAGETEHRGDTVRRARIARSVVDVPAVTWTPAGFRHAVRVDSDAVRGTLVRLRRDVAGNAAAVLRAGCQSSATIDETSRKLVDRCHDPEVQLLT